MGTFALLDDLRPWLPHLPPTVALAIVAVLGYFVGRCQPDKGGAADSQAQREIERAQLVARELEKIADAIRQNLSTHDASVARFKERVRELQQHQDNEAWSQLCIEAEEVLRPTLRLANEMAHAYDEIRRQTTFLTAFTEVRTDPLTGARNRRALDEGLETMFAMKGRYDQPFSVALFDVDSFKNINDDEGHLCGDRVLRAVVGIMADTARTTDIIARYGGDEFVLLMPQTDLAGARLLTDRLREYVQNNAFGDVQVTVSAGVAEAKHGEDAQSLLSRADKALYRAKNEGRNRVCFDEETVLFDESQPTHNPSAATGALATADSAG